MNPRSRRNPFVFNSGDVLIRLLAFYLIFRARLGPRSRSRGS